MSPFEFQVGLCPPKIRTIQYNASGSLVSLILVLCTVPIPGTRTDSDRQGREYAVHRFIALQSLINIRLVLVCFFLSSHWQMRACSLKAPIDVLTAMASFRAIS